MKITKIITPIAAIFLFLLAPVFSNAQLCRFSEEEKYDPEQAIIKKGDNLEFIKWCCEDAFDMNICKGTLTADGFLTHTAAKYKRDAVLKYLVDDLKMDYNFGNVKDIIPAMFAAESGYLATTKYLVEDKKTNVTTQDLKGCDTLCYAKKAKNPEPGLVAKVQEAWNKLMGIAAVQHKFKQHQFQNTMANTDPAKEIKNSLAGADFENLKKYLFFNGNRFFSGNLS